MQVINLWINSIFLIYCIFVKLLEMKKFEAVLMKPTVHSCLNRMTGRSVELCLDH